jgi:hypothetical protein
MPKKFVDSKRALNSIFLITDTQSRTSKIKPCLTFGKACCDMSTFLRDHLGELP